MSDRLYHAVIAAVLLAGAMALAVAIHRLPRAEARYAALLGDQRPAIQVVPDANQKDAR